MLLGDELACTLVQAGDVLRTPVVHREAARTDRGLQAPVAKALAVGETSEEQVGQAPATGGDRLRSVRARADVSRICTSATASGVRGGRTPVPSETSTSGRSSRAAACRPSR